MKKILVHFFLISIANLTFSQSNNLAKRLDSLTQQIKYNLDAKAGTSIIITKGDKTIYTASTGFSSIELKAQNTINTMYDLASIGKMFTGYSIATLEAQGKISMDDDIRKYLKDFPEYDHKITIGHLVHHTSGIKNWTTLLYQMGWSWEDKMSSDQFLRAIYAQKSLDFVPGEKYQYSNSGYLLLTKVIENVTGQTFVDWTNENIFIPLKMDNTFFNDNQNRIIDGMASAYMLDSNGNRIREAYNTSVLGSSSLLSNAIDMGKWMQFLLRPPKDRKDIVDIMFSTEKLNDGGYNDYAYGIRIDNYDDIKLIAHSGSWSSFTSYLALVPDHDIGIFFANNYRTYTRPILEQYLDVLFQKEEKKEVEQQTSTLPEEKVVVPKKLLSKYVGTYRLKDAWYLDITLDGNDLYTQSTGEGMYPMKPINDSTFVVPRYGYRTITFNSRLNGDVHQLVYNDIEGKRKNTRFYFNEKEFKKFEGVYFSTELDLLFEIKVDKNKMYYSNIKNGTYELYFENDKLFFSNGLLSKITFTYKDKGQVTGFYKVNSKMKKLYHFKKAN